MSADEADRGPVRIGELSRRVGVTPEVLRAWERRYGILSPTRTDGGFRLYGEDDERRVRRMLEHLEQGLSAAEAARLARADPPARLGPAAGTDDRSGAPTAAALGGQLRHALDGFDDVGAHSVLDRLLGLLPARERPTGRGHSLPPRARRALGARSGIGRARTLRQRTPARPPARPGARLGAWSRSARTARLRSRRSTRSRVDLLRAALRAHGWRITYLGADTPLLTLIETADLLQPALVVVTATIPELAQALSAACANSPASPPSRSPAVEPMRASPRLSVLDGSTKILSQPRRAPLRPGLTRIAQIADSCAQTSAVVPVHDLIRS